MSEELDLVGPIEIAQRAGVKRDTVEKWRVRHAGTFPAPIVRLAAGPVWLWRDVEAWLAIPRRPGKPPKSA
jgi:predicted DNA-binding transcriptional regulator AlpA